MAAKSAEPLSKLDRNSPEYKAILGGQYFEKLEQYGATAEEIAMIMADDAVNPKSGMPKALKDIVNSVYTSMGLQDYSPSAQKQAMAYIASGLTSAIGTSKSSTVDNKNYISDLQRMTLAAKAEGSSGKEDKDSFEYAGTSIMHPQFEDNYKDLTKALSYADKYIDAAGNLNPKMNGKGNAAEKKVYEIYQKHKNNSESASTIKQNVAREIAEEQNKTVIKHGIAIPLFSATDQANLLKQKSMLAASNRDGLLKRLDSSGVQKRDMDSNEAAKIIGEEGGFFGVNLMGESYFKSTNGEMYRVDPALISDGFQPVVNMIVDRFNQINSKEDLTEEQRSHNIERASANLKSVLSKALLGNTEL